MHDIHACFPCMLRTHHPVRLHVMLRDNPRITCGVLRVITDRCALVGMHDAHRTRMQRDVPGMTRGILPVLSELWWGPVVRAISVGVNSASPAPAVPLNEPFVWRDDATGAQVIAFWHAGGYGGEMEYKGHTLPLTPASDCVRAPAGESGKRHILCFSWRADNKGPFNDPKEVRSARNASHYIHILTSCIHTKRLSGRPLLLRGNHKA